MIRLVVTLPAGELGRSCGRETLGAGAASGVGVRGAGVHTWEYKDEAGGQASDD